MARHSHPLRRRLSLAGFVAGLELGLGLGLVSTAAAGDHGYLPAVGPPPLRFVAPRPSAIVPVEPPTNSPAHTSVISGATNAAAELAHTGPKSTPPSPDPTPEWFGPPAPVPVPAAPPEPPQLPPINPAWLVPDASQTVMPQAKLFLQYFTPDYLPGSNAGGLVVPVGFVPPQPRPTSSSSATYQVTPGGTGTTVTSGTK